MSRSPLTAGYVDDLVRRLPTFVQRAFSAVRVHDKRMPTLALRTKFKQAENAVATFKEHTLAWIGDVDAKMQRLGMEYVDPADNARCDEFVHDVGRSTLEKKALREALIYAADAKLKELRREIEQRERHDR